MSEKNVEERRLLYYEDIFFFLLLAFLKNECSDFSFAFCGKSHCIQFKVKIQCGKYQDAAVVIKYETDRFIRNTRTTCWIEEQQSPGLTMQMDKVFHRQKK